MSVPFLTTTRRQVVVFCCLSVGAWTLIPLFLFPNPPLDIIIALAWGRDFAWGYTQHPPLLSWLLAGAESAFGSVRVAYVLSGLCLGLSHWFLWRLAGRLGLSDIERLCALLINSATFYTTLAIPEFNHNVIQLPLWLGLIWLFHRCLGEEKWSDWLALGLVAGLGLLTKYSVGLLLGAIGLYALVILSARRCLGTAKPYAAALVALILFAPHVLWMIETDFLTLRYASARTNPAEHLLDHLLHPLDFLFGQIAALAPALAIVGAATGANVGAKVGTAVGAFFGAVFSVNKRDAGKRHKAPQEKQENLRRGAVDREAEERVSAHKALFIGWFLGAPLSMVLLVSLITGTEFRHMWGMPFFGLLGIALARHVMARNAPLVAGTSPCDQPLGAPRLVPLWCAGIAVQAVFLTVLLGQALLEPLWKLKPSRIHYPGSEIAQAVTDDWTRQMNAPLRFVAGDIWTAGNVAVFSPDKPSVFVDLDLDRTPWITQEDVTKTGLVVIWRGGAADQPALGAPYDVRAGAVATRTFSQQSWVRHAPQITVSWRLIAPTR